MKRLVLTLAILLAFALGGMAQQGDLVINPDTLTFEAFPESHNITIMNNTNAPVTINSAHVDQNDLWVMFWDLSNLPATLQPGQSIDFELYLNAYGYKGYFSATAVFVTSIGNRYVPIDINEEAWDDGLLVMPMQGLYFNEQEPLTQYFYLHNTNALQSITVYEISEGGSNYFNMVTSHELPYVISGGESFEVTVTLTDFPENATEANLYINSSDGEINSPFFHIAGGLSGGDDYHPIVEDGKQWNVLFSYPWNPPEPQHKYTDIYKIEGDTLVDGVSYKVMYTTRNEDLTGWSVCGVIRETEDKQVLYRRDGSSYDEILYDFSMEVGDTITMSGNGFYPDWMFVIETNEILVNGEPRQQIVLEYPWGDQEVWIEGIGSLYGIINSGSLFLMGGSTDLLCYYEDGDLIWQNTTPGYNECYIVNSGQQGNLAVTPDTLWFDEMYYYEKTFIINNPTDQPVTITDISADNQFVGGYYTDNHPLVGIYYWDNSIGRLCPMEEVLPITLEANGGIELIVELDVVWPWAKRDEFINVPINIISTAGHDVVTLMIGKEATSFGLVAYPPYIQLDYYNSAPFTVVSSEWDQPIIITGIEEVGTNYLEIIPDSPLPLTLQNYGDFLSGSIRVREGIHEFFETEIRISSSIGNAYIGVDNSLGFMAPIGNEWYYEIQNENGSITYQYMYQAGDTIVNDEPTHILVKINTLYDKDIHTDVTHEYVYERDGKLYWWNKTLEEFTVLYDFRAEAGDSWEIKVGMESLVMHVDDVEEIEYEGITYKMLHVSDPDDLFSGDIVCGIGHLTSFFPERLMDNGDGVRVEGLRCYWVEDELVFKYGDEDCDAIYEDLHGVEENAENQFNVYPNPTNGILFIETQCFASQPTQYRITNLIGQILLTGQITDENQQIDVSGLPNGMYFITVGGETRKFVVR